MTKTLKTTALAIALAGSTVLGMGTAFAVDAVITFDPGTVQYGYTDGYWTRDRVWHEWSDPKYIEVYRSHPGADYREWKHDRDPDMGWKVEIQK